MAVKSGKLAYVNNVPCTVNWQVSAAAAIERYAASCTNGGTATTEGNENWTGSVSGIGHTPALLPTGDDFTFKGVSDTLIAYDGTILVSQTQITIPVAAGGPIRWTSQFGVQGVLTEGVTIASDSTRTPATSAKNGKVFIATDFADMGSPTEIEAVQNIVITFNRPETTYVEDGVTKRFAGNLEVDVSFDVFSASLVNALYALNALGIVQVHVNEAGDYWEFGAMRFAEKSNFLVDAATRQPIGYTVNSQWNALVPSDFDFGNEGWIKNPADAYFFGAAPTDS